MITDKRKTVGIKIRTVSRLHLEILAKPCADLHPELRGVFPQRTPDEIRLFKLLKAAYVDARYNTSYAVTKAELEILARTCDLRSAYEPYRACRFTRRRHRRCERL